MLPFQRQAPDTLTKSRPRIFSTWPTLFGRDRQGDVANCAVTAYRFEPCLGPHGGLVLERYRFCYSAGRSRGVGHGGTEFERGSTMSSLTTITPDFLRQMKLPHPEEGDKKARGDVFVIAGGADVPGAALLAGTGALRAGAGRVQIATCAPNATALALAIPEALVLGLPETSTGAIDPVAALQLMPYGERANAVLLGPGLPDEAAIAALATAILGSAATKAAFLFDAGAIRHLGSTRGLLARHQGRIVITPHAGEMETRPDCVSGCLR